MGAGVTGRAVTEAIVGHGLAVVVADDRPDELIRAMCDRLDVELLEHPDIDELDRRMRAVEAWLPAPGLPDHHPAVAASRRAGIPMLSEFDLAAAWDGRPVVAVTGTNGKTTVTTLIAEMLEASAVPAALAGNTDVPLVAAIGDERPSVFVVEASSFRLGHCRHFAPDVAAWLNFAPDHLDVHGSLSAYEAAKARIWRDQRREQIAVANADDEVVMAHALGPAEVRTFGLGPDADATVVDDVLVATTGEHICAVGDLWSSLPHDRSNVLAAATVALAGGATIDGVRQAARSFRGLPHRVQLVAEHDGVRWYDDSKATAPHATAAAVGGFSSVVLIAGGRNKGLDLSVLSELAPRLRAVVGIGEAAEEVVSACRSVPGASATSMRDAVSLASRWAEPGDTVLLSPGCASFDWYRNYGERGDDFAREVVRRLGGAA